MHASLETYVQKVAYTYATQLNNAVATNMEDMEDRILNKAKLLSSKGTRFIKACLKRAADFEDSEEEEEEGVGGRALKRPAVTTAAAETRTTEEHQEQPEQELEKKQQEEQDNSTLKKVSGSKPSFRSKSFKTAITIKEMYEEYYGLGSFKGVPIVGGFYELEKKFKTKWRTKEHYIAKETALFIRWKKSMEGLTEASKVREGDESWGRVSASHAAIWAEHLRQGGLAGLVEKLQELGYIKKSGSRKKRTSASPPANGE